MENQCRIEFVQDTRTGHLRIEEWAIRIGGSHAESSGSSEKRKNVYKARTTPYQFALAVASYKFRESEKFSLGDKTWQKFRDNLQKILRRAENPSSDSSSI